MNSRQRRKVVRAITFDVSQGLSGQWAVFGLDPINDRVARVGPWADSIESAWHRFYDEAIPRLKYEAEYPFLRLSPFEVAALRRGYAAPTHAEK